jgi:protein SCO1/2
LGSRQLSIGVAAALVITAAVGAAFVIGRVSPPAPLTGEMMSRPVPNLPLESANGQRTSLAAFEGTVVVLAPFLTLCSEVCPLTTSAFEEMQRAVEADGLGNRVTFAEVSVDPWRDTPARLRAFHRLAHSHFPLLTGTRQQLAAFWHFFGAAYWRTRESKPPDSDWLTGKPLTFDVSHTDALFLVDPHGYERILEIGMPKLGQGIPATLRRLLDTTGRHDLAHPRGGWTVAQTLHDIGTLLGRRLPDATSRSTALLKTSSRIGRFDAHRTRRG